jgi:hypothetical protein
MGVIVPAPENAVNNLRDVVDRARKKIFFVVENNLLSHFIHFQNAKCAFKFHLR